MARAVPATTKLSFLAVDADATAYTPFHQAHKPRSSARRTPEKHDLSNQVNFKRQHRPLQRC